MQGVTEGGGGVHADACRPLACSRSMSRSMKGASAAAPARRKGRVTLLPAHLQESRLVTSHRSVAPSQPPSPKTACAVFLHPEFTLSQGWNTPCAPTQGRGAAPGNTSSAAGISPSEHQGAMPLADRQRLAQRRKTRRR